MNCLLVDGKVVYGICLIQVDPGRPGHGVMSRIIEPTRKRSPPQHAVR